MDPGGRPTAFLRTLRDSGTMAMVICERSSGTRVEGGSVLSSKPLRLTKNQEGQCG